MPTSPTEKSYKLVVLGYWLFFLGILFGITALIGVLINHTNYQQSQDTYLRSHLLWQIIAFWSLLAMAAIAALLWPSAIASVLLFTGIICWLTTLIAGIYFLRHQRGIPFLDKQRTAVSK